MEHHFSGRCIILIVRDGPSVNPGEAALSVVSGSRIGQLHHLGSHQHTDKIYYVAAPHVVFARGGRARGRMLK